jgi:hypothetical protein
VKKPSAFPSARIEAERLACLIEHRTTAAAVRELIAVSPEMEAQLRRDAEQHRR